VSHGLDDLRDLRVPDDGADDGAGNGPDDGTREGALFARRARVLLVPTLPPLEAILAEADAPRAARARRAKMVERGRAWAAAFAAAACVGALYTHAPGFEATGAIVADEDAGAPVPHERVRARASNIQLSADVSREELEGRDTCDPSSDEATGRSTCALTAPTASRGEPVARVLVDEAPGTCSEPIASPPARVDDVPTSAACDRAMSCSLANAGP
jgi:hypothetical protein